MKAPITKAQAVSHCWLALFLIFLLVACPVSGQVLQKQTLDTASYAQFGRLYFDKLSINGNWASHMMEYDEAPDTLHVTGPKGKTYKIADASEGQFAGERLFAALRSGNELVVVDLEKGTRTTVDGVDAFAFSKSGRTLVTFKKQGNKGVVTLMDEKLTVTQQWDGIDAYRMSPDNTAILFSQYNDGIASVSWSPLDSPKALLCIEDTDVAGRFPFLVWQNNNASVAALHKNAKGEIDGIFHFKLRSDWLAHLRIDSPNFPAGKRIADGYASKLQISYDGTKVFFGLIDISESAKYNDENPQIWNGNDNRYYPERKASQDFKIISKIVGWWPQSGRILQIATDEKPMLMLSGDQRYALTYTTLLDYPQYRLVPNGDYDVIDLETGKTAPWLKDQSTELANMSISPDGRYVAYLREAKWFIYTFATARHQKIPIPPDLTLTGCAGWANGGQGLLLYDRYDLWEYDPLSKFPFRRCTNGYLDGTTYRIAQSGIPGNRNFDGVVGPSYDLRNLILKGSSRTSQGYFLLVHDKLRKLIGGEFAISDLRASASQNFICITQRFDTPPAVYTFTRQGNARLLSQGNPRYEKYRWGRVELFGYRNSESIASNALLYYPANYDPSRKYPMVVHVYETQSNTIHQFACPSFYNDDGFNIANLTQQGYFVLLPDMIFRNNDPGVSASDAITAATHAALKRASIDPVRLGLIGHSFGGYETNFTLTQTDLFAAAVSGCGIFDTQSHYLSMAWNLGKPEIFRHEAQQWRMQRSLYDDREGYERNSPARFAANIKTPVFIWAGEADRQVHYYQSIECYVALRRMSKKQMMVLYPNETHNIVNPVFQKDLTKKVMDWFAYYLKKENPAAWIADGIK